MTTSDYYRQRKISPRFPSLADHEARRERRHRKIGALMLSIGYLAVGASLILIAIGSR